MGMITYAPIINKIYLSEKVLCSKTDKIVAAGIYFKSLGTKKYKKVTLKKKKTKTTISSNAII